MGSANSVESGDVQETLLKQLEIETKRAEDATDVDDTVEEVVRLRKWLKEVKAQVSELKDQATAAGADKDKNTYRASETTLEDGTKVQTFLDGSTKQVDPDGTVFTSFPDGRLKQLSPSGKSLETFPDGTKVTKMPDGKVIVKRPDGSKLQTNTDQSTIEVTKEGTMIQFNPDTRIRIIVEPDGTQTQTNEKDGSMIQVFPDGTKIDTDGSGCRIVKYTDGRKVQRNANGTVIETFSNGQKVQTKIDGSRIEVFPDGRKVQTAVDGTVITQLPDGTQTRTGGPRATAGGEDTANTFRCVQCSWCQTISSVPSNMFVVSCRVCRNVLIAEQSGVAPEGQVPHAKGAEEVEKDVRQIFEHYDCNNTQTIDRNKLNTLLAELQFPGDHFEELFREMDANQNNVLEWEEFAKFFEKMQRNLQATSQAPALAMTQELLAEQQAALQNEKSKEESHYAQLAASNPESEEAQQSAQLLRKLKEEYLTKSDQLQQTMELKRERQRKYLEQKLKQRKEEKLARQNAL